MPYPSHGVLGTASLIYPCGWGLGSGASSTWKQDWDQRDDRNVLPEVLDWGLGFGFRRDLD